MTPQTRSVPIWAVFIYPLPPPHQGPEPERSAIKIMNLLRYLHILPLSHSVINVIASLTLSETRKYWQQNLTPTAVEPLHLASPQGMKWLSVQMFSDFLCVLIVVQINIQVLWELKARVTITTALVMAEFNKGRLSQYLPKFSLSRNMSGNAIKRHLLLSLWLIVAVTTLAPWSVIMRADGDERCLTSNMKHCVSKIQIEAITVKKCRSAHCKTLYDTISWGRVRQDPDS